MSNWIKLEDRTPENEARVLVTVKEDTEVGQSILCVPFVYIAYYYEAGTERWYPFFFLEKAEDIRLTTEVTAWMPMPEAFEE